MNNNQFGMNSTNNQMNSNNFNQNESFNQPEQPTNFGQNQNNQPNNSNQNMNTFNEQPTHNNNTSKNKTFLIIGVIVIIVIIGAILLFSIFNGNSKNASTYVKDAKSIINGAEALVDYDSTSSVLNSTTSKYAPICSTYNIQSTEKTITLSDIINEGYFSNNSNISYDLNSSFVKVKAVISQEKGCNYEYYIYLTDGIYSIGTPSNPILKDNITNKSVTK